MIVIHDQLQTWTHTEPGLARFGACAPAPAADQPQEVHVPNLRKGFLTDAISVGALHGESLQRTDADLGSRLGRRLFCLKHGSSRAEITCAQSPLNGFSERDECHLKFPRASRPNALMIAQKRGQGRGHQEQERGRFIRDQRGADD